jgi:uncharacterized Zn finger protein
MRFGERFWPESKPRKAKGGIKARSQRGAFGTRWWAKRWIAVLEGLMSGARLQRGRRYARAGQVLDLEIAPGLVTASVQGSRARPYRVTIRVATLGKPAWRKIAMHIAGEARFAAALLAGEMPADIEEAFLAVEASLFPTSLRELHTDCSCPDWANPCKHVAATYYLLREEFDRDPFLLFALRGSTKRAILAELHDVATPSPAYPTEPEALPMALDAFWQGAPVADAPAVGRPTAAKARQRTLPPFPFWRGTEPLEATLARIDDAAVAAALALLADADADTR